MHQLWGIFKTVILSSLKCIKYLFCKPCTEFLSSAREVWVGHRNARRPSFRPSVRPTCEREILRTA